LFPTLLDQLESTVPDLDNYVRSDYLFPKQIEADQAPPNIYTDAISMMSTGVYYSVNYTHLLRTVFKIEPDMAYGYSMGECSSMWYSLGVWNPLGAHKFRSSPIFKNKFAGNLELLASHWGITTEEAKKRWLSLVLLAPIERVQELVDREELVYLTFINTDSELIISGDRDRCLSIAEKLKCPVITIPFQNIIHHDFCGREREGLLDMHNFPLENFPEIDFYSSLTKSKIPLESQLIAENSTDVCAQQVDFPSITKTVAGSGATIFIEVGANNTCTNWINTILQDRPHLAVAIDQKGKKESETIAATLAQLISHGVQADLSFIYPERQEEKEPARFLKTIQVGGARLFDLISNRETKQLFKEVQRKEPAIADVDLVTGSMVRTAAGREVITAASSVTAASLSKQHPHIDKQEVLREAVSSQQPLVFNASKMQSSVIAQMPDESGKKNISKKMELNTATAVAKSSWEKTISLPSNCSPVERSCNFRPFSASSATGLATAVAVLSSIFLEI
ncbi:MAG: hypothetical protein AAFN65_12150, partial [Bacteroidota bacterium]